MSPPLLRLAPLLLALLGLAGCRTGPQVTRHPAAEITVLLSIDGFRWDYLDLYEAPVLRALATEGVRARRMTSAFPSKTFPNHYTLVTGLRPENHGIVANWFWDPVRAEMFNMGKRDPFWWEGGEPVWITAEKQGVRTACYFWPGSETELQGHRPAFFAKFDSQLSNRARVEGLLAFLDRPEAERPRFGTLYFNNVDDAGHSHGPLAPGTAAAVREADDALGHLLAGLERLGLRARTNLVIVSDHGMMTCGTDRVIFFEDLMDVSQVRIESDGPNGGVRPLPESGVTPAELAASIRARAPPQLKVYLREEVPAGLHYRRSDRIPPIVLICADHWSIERKGSWGVRRATFPAGNHGWDPRGSDMGALFIAHGPSVRRGTVIGDFDNIHVYPLLCRLLGIRPAPSDGDDRLLRQVLR